MSKLDAHLAFNRQILLDYMRLQTEQQQKELLAHSPIWENLKSKRRKELSKQVLAYQVETTNMLALYTGWLCAKLPDINAESALKLLNDFTYEFINAPSEPHIEKQEVPGE